MKNSIDGCVYRSDVVARWCRGIALVTVAVTLLFILSPDNKLLIVPFEGLLLLFAVWVGVKLPRCGVYIEDGGVRVLNPLSTVSLRWSEVAGFEFRPYGPCAVKRIHGRPIAITGIQQSAWDAQRGASTQTATLIVELNALLDAQRGIDEHP